MTELTESGQPPEAGFGQNFALWANRMVLWISKHWLALTNTFFLVYVGLPILAPVLLAYGLYGPANVIYSLYRAACHQLPTHSHFIFGEQVAFCQRDVAIYGTLFLGGVTYGLVRHRLKPLALRWYLLFLIPIAVDGGMQMASQLLQSVPATVLWGIGLIILGLAATLLYSRGSLTWQSVVFLAFGPLALLYVQFVDPDYHSDWLRRSFTGALFAAGTVWFAYPYLEESFAEIHREVRAKLSKKTSSA